MGLFAELSTMIVVAALMATIMRLLKQPLIIGHILTGLIVGPFVLDVVRSTETLALLGEVGVAILLFTVGLHLSPAIVRQFGRVSIITAIGQVFVASVAGYAIGIWFGFSPLAAFYISVSLAFSSTIIVLKFISDKGDLEVLYAKIAIGFLLVQDLIAVLLLIAIPIFSATDTSISRVLYLLAAAAGLVLFVYLASRLLVSRTSSFLSESQEFLFLFSITWGIGVAALFQRFGFSLESGALIAGIALSTLPSRLEISARLTPLRDFFIIIFFIYLGSQLHLADIVDLLPLAFLLSTFVLISNPLIVMALLGYLGYKKKTGLQTGLTVAQISEFSLILVALGAQLGHVDNRVLSLVTLVGIITIFGSTYLVQYSGAIYRILSPYLNIFERAHISEPRRLKNSAEMILFGCNRIGYDFLDALKKLDRSLLVVDYDPDAVADMEKKGIESEFGDAGDISFLESLDFSKAQLVVSTIPDPETNALIHRVVGAQNPEAVVMVVAHKIHEALSHYGEGVDYVILPHFLGAKHAAELVLKFRDNKKKYEELREEHIEHLQLRVSIGHEHPHA
ncbi:cation:proton antiporter [Candidatus Kaiserbacteria bacterium]|nr:cation:proton antiporter [Candidatus Kaiserbacteria bacterium]